MEAVINHFPRCEKGLKFEHSLEKMAPWLRVVKVKVRGEENKPTDTDDNDCGATDPLSYHSSWALSWLWWKRKGGTEMAVTPPKAKACEGEARESPTNVACDGASVWPWKAWPQDAHEELHASAPTPAPPPVPPESPGREQFMPTASGAQSKFKSQIGVFIFLVLALA